MEAPDVKPIYTIEEFESLGFHDCYVHGISWKSTDYSFLLDLDYIVEWVENQGFYEFWISPAELQFRNVSDARLNLDWTKLAVQCQIQDIHKSDSKPSPIGSDDFHWEIELATPVGSIEFWASEFELRILESPVLRKLQCLR